MILKYMQEPFVRILDNPLLIASAQRQIRKKGMNLTIYVASVIGIFALVIGFQLEKYDQNDKMAEVWLWLRQGITYIMLYRLFLTGMNDVITGVNEDQKSGIFEFLRVTPVNPISNAIGYVLGLNAKNYLFAVTLLPFWFICALREKGSFGNALIGMGFIFVGSIVLHHIALVIGLFGKGKKLSWVSFFLLSMLVIFSTPLDQLGLHTITHITPFPALNSLGLTIFSDIFKGKSIMFYHLEISQIMYTLMIYAYIVCTTLWLAIRQLNRGDLPAFSRVGLIFIWCGFLFLSLGSDLNVNGISAFAKLNKEAGLFPGTLFYVLGSTLVTCVLLLAIVPNKKMVYREIDREILSKTSASLFADGSSIIYVWGILSSIQFAGLGIYLFFYHADPMRIILNHYTVMTLAAMLSITFCVAGVSEGLKLKDALQYKLALFATFFSLIVIPMILGELVRGQSEHTNIFHGLSVLYSLYCAISGLSNAMVTNMTEEFLKINESYFWSSLATSIMVGSIGFIFAFKVRQEKYQSSK